MNKRKMLTFSEELEKKIGDIQEKEGFMYFSETVMFLLRIGISKHSPAYISSRPARKSALEKEQEKLEAQKFLEEKERQDYLDMAESMGATVCDKHGNATPEGDYASYKIYSVLNGKPKRLGIFSERNPLWYIKENGIYKESHQYQGATKKEVEALLESGDYTLTK